MLWTGLANIVDS